MRRDRNRKVSGALRLIIYYTIIHTYTYMHRTTGEIQGGREAQPPGCTLHTLRSPSRRPQILSAGVRGFVARTRETETGGSNESARLEWHDTKHGNTPRRRHVRDHITSRNPPDVTVVSHSGGLRAIVRGRGRPRAAGEAAGGEWGTRWDAIGTTKVMTSRLLWINTTKLL